MSKQKYLESPSERQKKQFAKFLAEDEELVLVTGYGDIFLRHQFIIPGGVMILLGLGIAWLLKFNLGYGLLIGLVGASVLAYLQTMVMSLSHKYLLTTRRAIIKNGYFSVRLSSALYDKITHIEVEQSFYDRLFLKHGTVIINTAGSDNNHIILKYVESPLAFKNILERMINREREHYGRSTGPVVSLDGELVE